ncbi:MAG: hypothetical protein U0531_09670 [Dehalococcoidia bacterium]
MYRHAGAASVDLRLYRNGNGLRLTVEDDGGGPVGDESDAAGFWVAGAARAVALVTASTKAASPRPGPLCGCETP